LPGSGAADESLGFFDGGAMSPGGAERDFIVVFADSLHFLLFRAAAVEEMDVLAALGSSSSTVDEREGR
jgi:hypothetical protein